MMKHEDNIFVENFINFPKGGASFLEEPQFANDAPDVGLIDMRCSFTGVNKAWKKPWAGYEKTDQDLLQDLAYGRKVHSVDDIPDFHKRVLFEKYPDRI
jgi:hypothetical protein